MKKRGRPRREESKNRQYHFRMTDEEMEDLEDMAFRSGKSKAEVIRDALKFYDKVLGYTD